MNYVANYRNYDKSDDTPLAIAIPDPVPPSMRKKMQRITHEDLLVYRPAHMLTDTSKMMTVAAQMARSNRETKYEKDMCREPEVRREVLDADVVKIMAEASDRMKWPRQRPIRGIVPWRLR